MSINEDLRKSHKQFCEIISQNYDMLQKAIIPFQDAMKGTESHICTVFGEFITKILYPLNSSKIENNDIIGSKVWYRSVNNPKFSPYYNYSGSSKTRPKKIKQAIKPDVLFQIFSPEFVHTTKNYEKKLIVNEFLRFRNAVVKSLSAFNPKEFISIKGIRAEFIRFKTACIHDSLAGAGPGRMKKYAIPGEINNIVPDRIYMKFATKKASPLDDISFHHKLHSNIGHPLVLLFAFKEDRLIGTLNVPLMIGPPARGEFHDGEFQQRTMSLLDMCHSCYIKQEDVLEYGDGEYSFNIYNDQGGRFNVFTSNGIEVTQNTPVRSFEAELGLIVGIRPVRADSAGVLLNWNQIIQYPGVAKKINEYIQTWHMITKTWKYLQAKYSYKLIVGGHF